MFKKVLNDVIVSFSNVHLYLIRTCKLMILKQENLEPFYLSVQFKVKKTKKQTDFLLHVELLANVVSISEISETVTGEGTLKTVKM